jgi:hypothetical protein
MSTSFRFQISRIALALGGGAAALSLAGCGASGSRPAAPAATPAAHNEGWRGRDAVKDAIAALGAGKAVEARATLITALKRQPGDSVARKLLSEIDTDPKVLLGATSFAYVVRSGDSFSLLAERFLGDPLMFYALARYNRLTIPADPAVGQTILIPGVRPAPVRTEPVRTEPERNEPPRAAPPARKPGPAAAKPAPKPEGKAANPALASRLRASGLAAMNAGAIDRAVALLRQASAADPANGVIRNDLARALRVQATVHRR